MIPLGPESVKYGVLIPGFFKCVYEMGLMADPIGFLQDGWSAPLLPIASKWPLYERPVGID